MADRSQNGSFNRESQADSGDANVHDEITQLVLQTRSKRKSAEVLRALHKYIQSGVQIINASQGEVQGIRNDLLRLYVRDCVQANMQMQAALPSLEQQVVEDEAEIELIKRYIDTLLKSITTAQQSTQTDCDEEAPNAKKPKMDEQLIAAIANIAGMFGYPHQIHAEALKNDDQLLKNVQSFIANKTGASINNSVGQAEGVQTDNLSQNMTDHTSYNIPGSFVAQASHELVSCQNNTRKDLQVPEGDNAIDKDKTAMKI